MAKAVAGVMVGVKMSRQIRQAFMRYTGGIVIGGSIPTYVTTAYR